MRYAGLLLLPLALLFSCASADQPVSDRPVAAPIRPVARAFDLPALLGLNADQVSQSLTGTAIRATQDRTPRALPTGQEELRSTYWHDTTALVVSYDPATRRVSNYFIKTQHGLTADYGTLLKLAGISPFDKRLAVEPVVSAVNPQLYTGVKVSSRLAATSAEQ